jgi:elongation factor G
MGMEASAKKGYTVIQAVAPKAELADYPIILRAMSQGRGSFEFKVTGYDVVPANITAKVIAENKAE